jgi:hypothetical protein
MAIQNASDLLVYKKTSPLLPQITRIRIKKSTPIKDFTSGQNIIVNNITDSAGDITDGQTITITTNSGAHIINAISTELNTNYNYSVTARQGQSDPVWTWIDFTNGADGPVPTLEVLSGTAEFKAGAVEIVVIQSGQSLVYQPIAYSTSASISMNTDLRDITTKDSQGWQENAKGLGSFEMSTDALWDVNNAVGVESAVNDLVSGDSVDVKFSDRVRNLVATEEVYGDVAYWSTSNVGLNKHLEDPFGQFTAAQVYVSSNGSSRNYRYNAPIALLEGKRLTWSLYLKAFSATANSCKLKVILNSDSGTDVSFSTSIEKISGVGTVSSPTADFKKVTGVSTTSWTRVKVTTDSVVSGTDLRDARLLIYPGADHNNQTTADNIITASWQVETGTSASDYQNPTEVDCYQGKAFVNSVSVDAGVEDNATYSASFTGTSEIFVNGLGHELVGNNYFDGTETTVGLDKFLVPNWKLYNGSSDALSYFPGGKARFKWVSNGNTYLIGHNGVNNNLYPMVAGKEYELTYTISTYVSGELTLNSATGSTNPTMPLAVGTHTIRFICDLTYLMIAKVGTSGEVHISYISLKEVFS